ncbi:unnamed protein product [Polarella glacialis]|uniref:Uncharacterized protein n=1 Tax=Polarella glacialis TaxID=89957 RepID=A0A813GIL5_POLGL|nr:unnamed protein product [Polarella glacialis]
MRAYVQECVSHADMETTSLRQVFQFFEAKFGTFAESAKGSIIEIARAAVVNAGEEEEVRRRRSRRRTTTATTTTTTQDRQGQKGPQVRRRPVLALKTPTAERCETALRWRRQKRRRVSRIVAAAQRKSDSEITSLLLKQDREMKSAAMPIDSPLQEELNEIDQQIQKLQQERNRLVDTFESQKDKIAEALKLKHCAELSAYRSRRCKRLGDTCLKPSRAQVKTVRATTLLFHLLLASAAKQVSNVRCAQRA